MKELAAEDESVLIVDDHESVARTIARWLEREGYSCQVAHSVDEALDRADHTPFGVVLADVHMPDASGLELARTLKAADSAVQVIIITGSGTLDTAVQAFRVQADDYLPKPFEPRDLIHAVNRATEHRRLLVENRRYRHTLEERVRRQAERLEKLYLSSIHSLVEALEARDPHSRGHSDRVAEIALALLDRVGGVEPDALRIGAQLHDIGKIGVTGGILRKDGPLSGDERLMIHQHPTIGVQILSPLLEDRTILAVVRHHHERWDGAGYPDGLAGEAIPLAARIVAVADAYDAMTTARPYRSALRPAHAVAEIVREAGRQFDPVVAAHAADVFSPRAARVS